MKLILDNSILNLSVRNLTIEWIENTFKTMLRISRFDFDVPIFGLSRFIYQYILLWYPNRITPCFNYYLKN